VGRIGSSAPLANFSQKPQGSATSIQADPKITFPRSIRDALLAEGLAQEHRWVPNSGWITFQIRGEEDFKHAVWLMRLSYLRYALKTASDPRQYLDEQSEELQLSPQLKSLFQLFLPRSAAA